MNVEELVKLTEVIAHPVGDSILEQGMCRQAALDMLAQMVFEEGLIRAYQSLQAAHAKLREAVGALPKPRPDSEMCVVVHEFSVPIKALRACHSAAEGD